MEKDIITSPKTYALVLVALIALTVTTAEVSFVDLGWFNPVIAFVIASMKMLLVALFFMEVRHSSRITKITIGAGVFWFGILIALTLGDYLTRWWPT